MLNNHLRHHQNQGEQRLLHDLVSEAIQGHGLEVYYIPKNRNFEENVFGEDTNVQYKEAIPMELYPKNVENWDGEGDMISMFGMEFRDRMTFTISQFRWDQLKSEKLLLEDGQVMQIEGILPNNPASTGGFIIEEGTRDNFEIPSRPREGDLIYLRLNDTILKILNTEHESHFYPMGILPVYDITCEKFDYSSEKIDTGNEMVDAIEDKYSLAFSNDAILLENGIDQLGLEGGGIVILEGQRFDEDLVIDNYNDTIDNNFTPDPNVDLSIDTPKKVPTLDSNDNIIVTNDINDVIDNSEKHPFQWNWDI